MVEMEKDRVELTFKEKVKTLINESGSLPAVKEALQLVIDFYTEYRIKNVDSSIPDNDMLLFDYGIYDWQDGKGENYTIDITRQFYPEGEETDGFFQLHLILYFDHNEFRGIEAANKWSVAFETVSEWKSFVIGTEGYQLAADKQPKDFDIFLVNTD